MTKLLLSLLVILQTAAPRPVGEPGSLDGVVVHLRTGEPIPGVQVSLGHLLRLNPGSGLLGAAGVARRPQFRPVQPVITDANGRFSFKDVDPGTLALAVTSNRYVLAAGTFGGVNDPNRVSIRFDLAPHENRNDLVVRITEAGMITGRIVRSTGQAAVAVPIQVWSLDFQYRDSKRTYRPVYSTNSDDRGQYRVAGISPGRYYLTVGTVPGHSSPGSDVEFSYYPGTAAADKATMIRIRSDSEFRADLVVSPRRVYRIRGRVIDSRTGQPPKDARLNLRYATDHINGTGASDYRPRYDPATGVFVVEGVAPGAFILEARAVPSNAPVLEAEGRVAATASRIITVSQDDLEGVELRLSPPFALESRVVVEGDIPADGSATPPRLGIGLVRLADSIANDWLGFGSTETLGNRASGSFSIAPLHAGEYVLRGGLRLPAGFYIKSVKLGEADALNQPLLLSGPTSEVLELTLSSNVGRIRGTVAADGSRRTGNIQVALIPDQRNRWDLYHRVLTDADGRFAFADVAPGEYKVFAWEVSDPDGYLNPSVLKEGEELARPVHVEESTETTTSVPLIVD